MKNYDLMEDEVVLYHGNVLAKKKKEKLELILTNYYLVLIKETKKLFSAPEVDVEKHSVNAIKIYKEKPQVCQKENFVEVYMTSGEMELLFADKKEAKHFVRAAFEICTGKSRARRGFEKVKKAVATVNEELGIDTIDAVASLATTAVSGKTKIPAKLIGEIAKKTVAAREKTNENKQLLEAKQTIEQKEAVDSLKKLKELLDEGIITQEEYNEKKKLYMDSI